SLGAILVARRDRGVCAIALGDDPDALARELQDRFPHAHLIGGDARFQAPAAEGVRLGGAPAIRLARPLDGGGTAFPGRRWTTPTRWRASCRTGFPTPT